MSRPDRIEDAPQVGAAPGALAAAAARAGATGRSSAPSLQGAAPARGRWGAGTILLSALWWGLAGAAAELAARGAQGFALGGVMRVSRDAVWMMPVGLLLLLAPIALVLLAAGGRWHRLRTPFAVTATLSFPVFASLLLLSERVPFLPMVVLAGGLAAVAARAVRRWAAGFRAVAVRTAPALGVVLLVAAAAVGVLRVAGERRVLAALPAAASDAPNVLLIIWDTVRAASVGLYSPEGASTPRLAAFAERGVVFEQAYAPSSWTLPSHASMFTGELPVRLSAGWVDPLDDRDATIAEAFTRAGYETAGFAANLLYVDWEHGLARGFARWEDYPVSLAQILVTPALGARLLRGDGEMTAGLPARLLGVTEMPVRVTADDVNGRFLDWLDDRGDRPFFAFLNFFDAHRPYLPPAPFDGLAAPRPEQGLLERVRREWGRSEFWSELTQEEVVAEESAYRASIAHLDARLGALLDALEQRGMADNTLVVITSDHGEEFGEHGRWEHGTGLSGWQTRVPLVLALPGAVPGGRRIAEPVSLADLPATLSDLAGLRPAPGFRGRSMAALWADAPADAGRPVVAMVAPGLDPGRRFEALVEDRYHFIRGPDGGRDLFDLGTDPLEKTDVADAPWARPFIARFDAVLDSLVSDPGAAARAANGH